MNYNKNRLNKSIKDKYFQYIRGICIICVILIHCRTGVEYIQNSNFSWNYYYWIGLRQLINFPVAMFIFMSAYFTDIDRTNNKSSYYLSKIKSIGLSIKITKSILGEEKAKVILGF